MTLDFHTVSCRVITDAGDDLAMIGAGFHFFLPDIDFAKEKIHIIHDPFIDASEVKRYVCSMSVERGRFVRLLVKTLFGSLSAEQKKMLHDQIQSRVDDECQFFLRFEKDAFLRDKKLVLTDGGRCFHITLTVASFPRKKAVACATVEKYLKQV